MGRSVEVGVRVGVEVGVRVEVGLGVGVKHGKWRQREKLLHKDTKAGRNTAEPRKRKG